MSNELSQALVALAVVVVGHITLWLSKRLSEARKARRKGPDLDGRIAALEARAGLHGNRLTALEEGREGYRNGLRNGRKTNADRRT
jgi:hypothetical protein